MEVHCTKPHGTRLSGHLRPRQCSSPCRAHVSRAPSPWGMGCRADSWHMADAGDSPMLDNGRTGLGAHPTPWRRRPTRRSTGAAWSTLAPPAMPSTGELRSRYLATFLACSTLIIFIWACASGPQIPKFVSERATNAYELRNLRATSTAVNHVLSVTFWASAASCWACSVRVSSCLRACSVESSTNAAGDFTPANLCTKWKVASVFA